MLWGEKVKYQGNVYTVTSTYNDGTVDLDNGANVHYKGKLCEVISINALKQTAQVAEVDQMFPPVVEVKASDLD